MTTVKKIIIIIKDKTILQLRKKNKEAEMLLRTDESIITWSSVKLILHDSLLSLIKATSRGADFVHAKTSQTSTVSSSLIVLWDLWDLESSRLTSFPVLPSGPLWSPGSDQGDRFVFGKAVS